MADCEASDESPPWHSQKTFTVELKHMTAPWCGFKDGRAFRCHLCGHFFVEGDRARFVMSVRYVGNVLVCDPCDGPDVRDHCEYLYEEARRRFWWMRDREYQPARKAYVEKYGNPPAGGVR